MGQHERSGVVVVSVPRRTLLKAVVGGAVAATVGTAVVATARHPELQAWLDARARQSATVVLPASAGPWMLAGEVRVPPGMNLVVRGDLFGTPAASLVLRGNTSIRFEGGRCVDVPLRLMDGTIRIQGLAYSGTAHLAAVLIDGPGPFRDLRIEDISVADANYGILRQGARSTMIGAVVRRGRFTRLRGDAIEWNLCSSDSGVLIEDHVIEGIDNRDGKPNWGIGVGVAGTRYAPHWARASMAKRFVVRNVRGSSLRQLIHVEAGADFRIEAITGHDVSGRYSANSGMPTALIACYGCADFTIDGVRGDGGSILLYAGAAGGRYITPSTNFAVSDVRMTHGDIGTQMGGRTAFARFGDVALSSGSLILSGAVQHAVLSDVDIVSPGPKIEPLRLDPAFLAGPLAVYRPLTTTFEEVRVTKRRGTPRSAADSMAGGERFAKREEIDWRR